jgi:hypothetical protein
VRATSQANVDLVLESTRRFVVGDMEGLAALYTPNAVGFAMEGWPEAGGTATPAPGT